MTSMTSFWFFIDNFEHFAPFSTASNVEKVNASWVTGRKVNFKTTYLYEKSAKIVM